MGSFLLSSSDPLQSREAIYWHTHLLSYLEGPKLAFLRIRKEREGTLRVLFHSGEKDNGNDLLFFNKMRSSFFCPSYFSSDMREGTEGIRVDCILIIR